MPTIYIDFECLAPRDRRQGAAGARPLLLGVLWPDGAITQYLVDARLADAARADKAHCRVASLPEAVTDLISVARRDAAAIASWTQHDRNVIAAHGHAGARLAEFDARYVNAAAEARRWARVGGLVLPPDRHSAGESTPGSVGPRVVHSLDRYMAATGYVVPARLARVAPASLLRHVLRQVEAHGGRYRATTPQTKRDWHLVLQYNREDLLGLRHVHARVSSDLEKRRWQRQRRTEA
jgi:hypothetical protein